MYVYVSECECGLYLNCYITTNMKNLYFLSIKYFLREELTKLNIS